MPAAAMTSASPSFAHVTPIAPAAISLCASAGTFWPLVCGRQLDAGVPAVRRQSGDVRLDHGEVRQQDRRVEVLDRPPDVSGTHRSPRR